MLSGTPQGSAAVVWEGLVQWEGLPGDDREGGDGLVFSVALIVTMTDSRITWEMDHEHACGVLSSLH